MVQNPALAPVSDRLHPETGALLETGFDVLIGEEISLPLHQAESARIEILEGADLEVTGIAKRPPKAFALAVEDREPIGIVNGRAEVVDVVAVVRAIKEHAGHRRQPRPLHFDAWVDGHLDIEDCRVPWPYGESVTRRAAFAVEQSVDHQRGRAWRRPLEPEGLEEGKFLALGFSGIDRKSPGGKPVRLPFGDGSEVARAEEDADLVVIVRTVDRRVDTEAGKAEVGLVERRDLLAEGKVLLTVFDLGGLSVRDLEDVHPVLVEEAAMEELRFERKILAAPKRTFGQEADRAVLIVVEILQAARQLLVRRFVGFSRQHAGEVPHGGRAERAFRRDSGGETGARSQQ